MRPFVGTFGARCTDYLSFEWTHKGLFGTVACLKGAPFGHGGPGLHLEPANCPAGSCPRSRGSKALPPHWVYPE